VLDQLGYGAYNFHPGPPQYPGWAPAHFALYDQATEFGATLHVMVKRVDVGPIVDVARFPVPADISVAGLEELAYAHLAHMFWRSAELLATRAEPLTERPIRWSKKRNSRRSYEAICNIPMSIPREELERRIKVFGAGHHGIAPTINLHGIQFRAVLPGTAEAEGALRPCND
jgi:methionyl-tRNA formyltransferase